MSTTENEILFIDGMHCDHCVDAVREALEALDGVTIRAIEIGRAEVAYDPSTTSEEQVIDAVEGAGYDLAS